MSTMFGPFALRNDGYLDGAYAEASITIVSESPTVSIAAAISPDPAYTTNTVTCAASLYRSRGWPLAPSYTGLLTDKPSAQGLL